MEALDLILNNLRKQTKIRLAKGFLVEEELDQSKPENIKLISFRKNKCKGNEDLNLRACMWYDKKRDECKYCGCVVDLKVTTKVNLNIERGSFRELLKNGGVYEETHCPMGKWNDKETANFYREKYGEKILT